MLDWLAPIVVFGVVVFVHELGHFLAAKAMGVYAPRFSIGFGPALWRKRWGETEYQLAALPLGGFVRMASKEDEDIAFLEGGSEAVADRRVGEVKEVGANDAPPVVSGSVEKPRARDWDTEAMAPFGPKPIPPHRYFESKSLPARLLILIAGVTMNALLTFAVSTGVFAAYGRTYVPAVVDSVVAGQPAALAGLRQGDSVVAVDGQAVRRWDEVVERISASPGRELVFQVQREGQPAEVRITPQQARAPDPLSGRPRDVGRIGVAPKAQFERDALSFPQAVVHGWNATWRLAASVVDVVKGLITREVPVSNLGGIITIARVSVDAARGGVEVFLGLLAFLSINIAVLNLLPIPILDGGQIVMQLLEAAKGRPFSDRTREVILRAGLAALLLLFVVVMWNDIARLFS